MNKSKIEKDLMEIVDKIRKYKNWSNSFDTKELFAFKEVENVKIKVK